MENYKIKLLRMYGTCNAFSLSISGIFGFIEISNNQQKNVMSNYIINIYAIIASLLLLYFEINNEYHKEEIALKMMDIL